MHPEVKRLLNFAVCWDSFFSNTPFIIKKVVTKSKIISQSASNFFCENTEQGTSENLRKETYGENIKEISIHLPKHKKPITQDQFGHYLAGLIDGDGHFSKNPQLVICFHLNDVSLAYFIKSYINHGTVKKVKDKNAYIFVLSSKSSIMRVLGLINNKLRTINKYDQVINNVLPSLNENFKFKLNQSLDLENYWLAGFSDADASFQVKILNRDNRRQEIRLNYQVDQKNREILDLIKNLFGGNIGYRSSQNTYYYGSTSFGSAKKVIKYFDCYHLQSSKHINYLKWRKVYLLIQNKEHQRM